MVDEIGDVDIGLVARGDEMAEANALMLGKRIQVIGNLTTMGSYRDASQQRLAGAWRRPQRHVIDIVDVAKAVGTDQRDTGAARQIDQPALLGSAISAEL